MNWMLATLGLGLAAIAYRVYRGDLFNPLLVAFLYGTVFFFLGLTYAVNYEEDGIFLLPITRWLVIYSFLVVFACLMFFRLKRNPAVLGETALPDHRAVDVLAAGILLIGAVVLTGIWLVGAGFNPFAQGFESSRIEARQGLGVISLVLIALSSVSGLVLATAASIHPALRAMGLLVASLVLYATGNRAPLLRFLLAAFVLLPMVNGRRVSMAALAAGSAVLLALMAVLGAVRKGINNNFTELSSALLDWRPFVNIYNLDLVLRSDLGMHPLMGESILIELRTLAPGYQPNFGTWLKDYLGLQFEGGSVTASYVGVAYADFGLIGALLAPFAFSFILDWAGRRARPLGQANRFGLVVLLFGSLSLADIFSTGLVTPVLYNLVPLCGTVLLFLFARGIGDGLTRPITPRGAT